jgi:AraC family transcriptional activator of pobA
MRGTVPTYELYGEEIRERPDFWIHCETLFSRSSIHRFEIDLHRHENFFQLLHIRDGEGDAMLDGREYAIAPGSVITVPAGVVHGFRFSRDIEGMIVTVMSSHLPFKADHQGQSGRWLSEARLTVLASPADADYVDQTFLRLADEFNNSRDGRDSLLETYLRTVLMLTLRSGLLEGNGENPASTENERRVIRLNELIRRHFRELCPPSFYANQLNLSTTHLNRIVKTVAGVTTQELIARKVIDAACRDLVFTPGSVQAVGAGLGFADPAYFSRFFQRQKGVTPRTYRQEERRRLAEDLSQ